MKRLLRKLLRNLTWLVIVCVTVFLFKVWAIPLLMRDWSYALAHNKPIPSSINLIECYDKPFIVEVPVVYKLTLADGLHVEKVKGVFVTPYMNRKQETDDSPNHTATGRMVSQGMCAVSQDFIKEHKIQYGDLVYIEKTKQYLVVDDCMNIRHKKAMDIFFYKTDKKVADEFKPFRSDIYILSMRYNKKLDDNTGAGKGVH